MSIMKRDALSKAGLNPYLPDDYRKRLEGVLMQRIWGYRSAITGRFVSKAYAEKHPDTTVKVQLRDVAVKHG